MQTTAMSEGRRHMSRLEKFAAVVAYPIALALLVVLWPLGFEQIVNAFKERTNA